jgi:hypothetical protein
MLGKTLFLALNEYERAKFILTFQMNLNELSRTLGYPEANQAFNLDAVSSKKVDSAQQRRVSMEHMDLIKMTPGSF